MTDKVFFKKMDEMDSQVETAVKQKGKFKTVRVSYSAYPTTPKGNPRNNLSKVAVKGKSRVVVDRDPSYGGKKSKPYKSPVVENPTWLDLTVFANDAIATTKDTHHSFFEGVEKVKEEDGVTYYELVFGS
jgi:hypothetical protein